MITDIDFGEYGVFVTDETKGHFLTVRLKATVTTTESVEHLRQVV